MIRLAHLSDIHVTAPDCRWRRGDWFNKRLSSWINLRFLGRGQRFAHTDAVLKALRDDLREQHVDHVIFSGDATALGFAEETARAAELLGVGGPDALPGLAVPGNHDYTTHADRASGHFEKHFAPWQYGERIGDAVYPFAQRVGPAWLVGVNSATPNVWPWDASGGVGAEQLARLEALLARLDGGPRILVTHYPVLLANGRRENGRTTCGTWTRWWMWPGGTASACGCTATATTLTSTPPGTRHRSRTSAPAARRSAARGRTASTPSTAPT